ncbi:MAG: hypothetical protein OXR66_06040 [Candidatus Woesearchaeota archaeon]|nr:hypothetical protein [Candidatus Woesearchaeota archaeon]
MRRRGEISMEVIIIAAIALLVLVILSVLVLRSGNLFASGTSCEGVGGQCEYDCDEQGGEVPSRNSCSDPEQKCCVKVLNSDDG